MKGRNRKRKSKVKSPAKSAGIAEIPASPSEISVDTEIVTSYPDVASDSEIVASHPDTLIDSETAAASPNMPSDAKSPAGLSVAPTGADRRIHPRYEFTAAVEVLAADSGARIETHVRDLSQQGCYVDTSDALPLGTVTDVRVKKERNCLKPGRESFTQERPRVWDSCLPALRRSTSGLLKHGLRNPAKLPGSRPTAEGVNAY